MINWWEPKTTSLGLCWTRRPWVNSFLLLFVRNWDIIESVRHSRYTVSILNKTPGYNQTQKKKKKKKKKKNKEIRITKHQKRNKCSCTKKQTEYWDLVQTLHNLNLALILFQVVLLLKWIFLGTKNNIIGTSLNQKTSSKLLFFFGT
jgi:hypothetical protein